MRELKELLINHLSEFIKTAESKDIIKNAYRIYNLINSIKAISELEKLELEKGYDTLKNLVIMELIEKYPELADTLKLELNDAEIPL